MHYYAVVGKELYLIKNFRRLGIGNQFCLDLFVKRVHGHVSTALVLRGVMAKIIAVDKGSIGEELGLEIGDELVGFVLTCLSNACTDTYKGDK